MSPVSIFNCTIQTERNFDSVRSGIFSATYILFIRGGVTFNDGKQGYFQCDDSNFSTPDDNTNVIVDLAGHRWERILTPASGGNGGSILIDANNVTLQPGVFYAVKTSLGVFNLNLPPLIVQFPPTLFFIDIADIDNNAGNNPFTINGFGFDEISDHGILGSSYTVNISNTIARIIPNQTSWTAISYGM